MNSHRQNEHKSYLDQLQHADQKEQSAAPPTQGVGSSSKTLSKDSENQEELYPGKVTEVNEPPKVIEADHISEEKKQLLQ